VSVKKILKRVSSHLQRFPTLWKVVLVIYEFKAFDPSKLYYRNRGLNESFNTLQNNRYKIIFDAQCLQTVTRERGIGTYSLKFIKALCQENSNTSFAAILTTVAAPDDLALAIKDLQSLNCSNLDVLVLDPFEGLNKVSFKQARRMLTQKLEIANCETLISLSPFEKHDSVITIPKSTKYKQVGILYDLIRLQYPKQFLFSKKQKTSFYWSLEQMKQFDLLLAISQETRNHWINLIGTQQNISVIYGGCDPRNIRDKINFQDRHGVMCVGAEQTHKNIERLIRAYSQLPLSLQIDHPLTIVGIRSKGVQKKLLKLGKSGVGKVNLPDYLNSVELELIYENSRLLVMPSIIEGLSMPILEAWSHDLPVIGSIGTVAEEIIQDKQLLFNPYETEEITNKMQNFLVSKSDWDIARNLSIEKASVFTWSRTAKSAMSAIESVSDG